MKWDPDTSSVLDVTGDHRQLIAEADHYANLAGIPKGALCVSLSEHASESEVKWVKNFRKHSTIGIQGMVWTGKHATVVQRAQALAGCLVRNFIDARLRTLDQIVENYEECSCLIVPDFYLGESVRDWQRDKIIRVLLKHQQSGHRIVVYIADLDKYAEAYGELGLSLIKNFPKLQLA